MEATGGNGMMRWAKRITAFGGALAVMVGLVVAFDNRYEKASAADLFREEIRANIVDLKIGQLLIHRTILNEQRRGGGRGLQRIVDELRDVERQLDLLRGHSGTP